MKGEVSDQNIELGGWKLVLNSERVIGF
ncbi:hypothetical protein [Bacillus thuringiensis]